MEKLLSKNIKPKYFFYKSITYNQIFNEQKKIYSATHSNIYVVNKFEIQIFLDLHIVDQTLR